MNREFGLIITSTAWGIMLTILGLPFLLFYPIGTSQGMPIVRDIVIPEARWSMGRYGDNIILDTLFVEEDKDIRQISGTSYDRVHRLLGHGWRLPTMREVTELLRSCQWELTTRGERKGYIVSRNGQQIFLPFNGCVYGSEGLCEDNSCGYYWTGDRLQDNNVMYLTKELKTVIINNAQCGIRPVKDK